MEPLALGALTGCIVALATGLAIMVVLLCRPSPTESGPSAPARDETPSVRRAHAAIGICFIVAGASAVVLAGAGAQDRRELSTADAGLWRVLGARVDLVEPALPRSKEHRK